MSVEHVHIPTKPGEPSGKDAVEEFMISQGYVLYGSIFEDLLFIHPSMVPSTSTSCMPGMFSLHCSLKIAKSSIKKLYELLV